MAKSSDFGELLGSGSMASGCTSAAVGFAIFISKNLINISLF